MNLFELSGMKKKKILVRGPVLTQSGYGVHARQIVKWLFDRKELDVDVQALPWGDTPWLIDKNLYDGFIGRIMEKTIDPAGRVYDATIQIQLPNEWDTSFSKTNIGVTASVETDKCNPEWINDCNKMSLVIVPSQHAKNSLTSTGTVTTRLCVVPEAFSEAITRNEKSKVDDVSFSTNFNFLIFGQITGNNPENERKNIFYTVKWLCEVFEKDKDVGIIIKTNSGRNTCIDRKLIQQTFENLVKEVRKGPFPKIHLLHGDLSDEEVASLYKHRSVKSLISLTKGEGYGLPILEAAASALPVIATNWSGHKDFLSHGKFIEIDYKLLEIHSSRVDNKIFMKGSKWANPIEEDFKRKVSKFRSGSLIPKEWAISMSQKIQEKYSIEAVKLQYDEATKDLI